MSVTSVRRRTFPQVTHCIFDFDGTLINSEDFLSQAIEEVIVRYDKRIDWSLKSRTVGLPMGLSGPLIIEELDLPLTHQQFTEHVLNTYYDKMSSGRVEFMPGAKPLVQHLAAHRVPQAVCSACTAFTFALKVKHFGDFFDVGKHFDHIVIAGDDPNVKRNKPFADPYLHAISQFDPPPDPRNVLVFEDSPTGLQSALSAGCQVILIPDSRFDRKQLSAEATLVIDSLDQFEPHLFGLPEF